MFGFIYTSQQKSQGPSWDTEGLRHCMDNVPTHECSVPRQGDCVHGIHKEQFLPWAFPELCSGTSPEHATEHTNSEATGTAPGHCQASSPGASHSAHTLGHCTWQMGARPWFSALVSSHSALPIHKPSRVTFLPAGLEDFIQVMCCYLLFQSLVSSPEAKVQLPSYLAQLKEQTKKELTTINNSSANLGAIVTILDMVSSIPVEAEELTMQVRFYFVLPTPTKPFGPFCQREWCFPWRSFTLA